MTAQLHAYKGSSNLVTVPALPWTQLIWEQRTGSLGATEKTAPERAVETRQKSYLTLFRLPARSPSRDLLKEQAAKEAEVMRKVLKKAYFSTASSRHTCAGSPAVTLPRPLPLSTKHRVSRHSIFGELLAFVSLVLAFDCEVVWQKKLSDRTINV